MYPFNPNYISDYKGYQLGMNVDEIDRLLAHREQSLYVNSAKEFQTITKISDSLLQKISSFFNFPNGFKRKIIIKIINRDISQIQELMSQKLLL